MNQQANSERGAKASGDGRGGLFVVPPVPDFYRPENAVQVLDGHTGFVAGHGAVDWVEAVRARGVEAVRVQGLPTPLLERWKYSSLGPKLKGLALEPRAVAMGYEGADGLVRALGDGRGAPEWVRGLIEAGAPGRERYRDMGLWMLADAYLQGAVFVDVPVDKIVEKPLELAVVAASGGLYCQRVIVRVQAGAQLTIIEDVTAEGSGWANNVAQIVLEDGAVLRHYRLQDCALDAVFTQSTHVMVGAGARYEAFVLTKGAGFSRNQVHVELRGAEGFVGLNGVNLLRGAQVGDSTFLIEHQAPDCGSSQMVRSVLDQQARGVFQGKVHVHQAAQRTDGYQLCNTLILSEGAEMDTKPELEIYADDVKCSHGTTTGQVDDEALFYLRSRGVGMAEARAMLIEGFLAEVVGNVADEALRELYLGKIREWLKAVG